MPYSEDPPTCAPTDHSVGPQLSDGTYPTVCTACGVDLEDYTPEELEELWHKEQVLNSDPPAYDTERELDIP